jgi:HEAT repeat protein
MRWLLCVISLCLLLRANNALQAQQQSVVGESGKSLAKTFAELLPGMGAADMKARDVPQQTWQKICVEASAPGKEALRLEVCRLMSGKLGGDVAKPARVWLLQQLQRIGGEECLEQVAAAARDKDAEIRDDAVRCLANNASPKATARLVSLVAGANGVDRVGILNALAHRQDAQARPTLIKEVASTDKETVRAAARALGAIPGQESAKVLAAARATASKETRAAIDDAYLLCADQFLKQGKNNEALAIYQELDKEPAGKAIRLAALRGTLRAAGDDAAAKVLDILRSGDRAVKQIAVVHIGDCSAAVLKPIVEQLPKLPAPSQVMVLTALAGRGDKSLMPVASAASKSNDAAIQEAGILALGRLGDVSVVPMLLGKLAAKPPQSNAAIDSLAQLRGDDVTARLVDALTKHKDQAATIIVVLQRRKAAAAMPTLLDIAQKDDGALRNAAFAAFKDLAEPHHLSAMVAALSRIRADKDREQAQKAIVAVCRKIANADQRAEAVLTVYDKSPPEYQIVFLPLLGELGGPKALKQIQAVLASGKGPAFDAAFRALCNWPEASVSADLERYAQTGPPPQREKALQALIRMNAALTNRPLEARLESLKKAFKLADNDAGRKLALEAMGNVRHIETLRFVVRYLDDKTFAQAACKAVVELAHSKMLREPNRAEFRQALDRVIAICTDTQLVDRAKMYKQQS